MNIVNISKYIQILNSTLLNSYYTNRISSFIRYEINLLYVKKRQTFVNPIFLAGKTMFKVKNILYEVNALGTHFLEKNCLLLFHEAMTVSYIKQIPVLVTLISLRTLRAALPTKSNLREDIFADLEDLLKIVPNDSLDKTFLFSLLSPNDFVLLPAKFYYLNQNNSFSDPPN